MTKKSLFVICGLCLVLFSCNFSKNKPIPVKFERFDKAVFSQNLAQLVEKYRNFTPFYTEKIIEIGNPVEEDADKYFKEFQKMYQKEIYDSVKLVFGDMHKIEEQLGEALGNYKAVFLQDSLPQFYTHFSGFNTSIVATKGIISVSLEKYLGKSSLYDKLGIYHYLRPKMYPEKISVDILKMLLLYKVSTKNASKNLLATMIYQGKILYALQQFFPNKSIGFLLNYSPKKEEWCEENEGMMWQFIIEEKHLFNSDYKTISGYIDEAPFTKGFPSDSPGQTGIWIGYQIVKNYMKNTEVSLKELFDDTDYGKILKESKYNPEA